MVLFCCRWYDQYAKTKKPRVDDYFRSINIKALYRTDEPYILANQATQIFFLEDRFLGYQDWRVVQKLVTGIRLMKLHNKMMIILLLM